MFLVPALVAVLAGCWLQSGYGPERNGANPNETALTVANVGALAEFWTANLGSVVSNPMVGPRGVVATAFNVAATRNLADGTKRWSTTLFPADLPVPAGTGAPVVVGGSVLVPVGIYRNLTPGSGVHRLDAASGTDTGVVSRNGLPTVRASKLAGTFGEIVGTFQAVTGVFVTDLANPSASWLSYLGAGDLPPSPTPAAVGTDRMILGNGTGVLAYPLTKPSSCTEPLPGFPFCQPLWSYEGHGGDVVGNPVLSADDATAYVATGGNNLVIALQASAGSSLWHGVLAAAPSAAPAVAGGRVYVPLANGNIAVFPADGCGGPVCNPLWTAPTGSSISVQPAIAGGVLYTGSADGSLHAFAAAGCGAPTCPALWSKATGSPISGAPAVAGGRLYVGTQDGRLIAYAPS